MQNTSCVKNEIAIYQHALSMRIYKTIFKCVNSKKRKSNKRKKDENKKKDGENSEFISGAKTMKRINDVTKFP